MSKPRLTFQALTIRNFWSVGNVTQDIRLDQDFLTLVIGANADVGPTNYRNGVGKTTILQALYYALFGEALTDVKIDNLINNCNQKGMLVTISFTIGETEYRIERGRKPNVLRFFVGGGENEAQGENRHTQEEIERALGMSGDLFRHVVGLNTLTDPFLKLKAADQRTMIEELLGIAQLSERATICKERRDHTKEQLKAEEIKLNADREANSRIELAITRSKREEQVWEQDRQQRIAEIEETIEQLGHFDFDAEDRLFDTIADWDRWVGKLNAERDQAVATVHSVARELAGLEQEMVRVRRDAGGHHERNMRVLLTEKAGLKKSIRPVEPEVQRNRDAIMRYKAVEKRLTARLEERHVTLTEIEQRLQRDPGGHLCPSCGQGLDGTDHLTTILGKLQADADHVRSEIAADQAEIIAAQVECDRLEDEIRTLRDEHAGSLVLVEGREAEIDLELAGLQQMIEAERASIEAELAKLMLRRDDHLKAHQAAKDREAQIVAAMADLGARPVSMFVSRSEVWTLRQSHASLQAEITNERQAINPHTANVRALSSTLKMIDRSKHNDLTTLLAHQEFLLKLLTSKDSFVRKRIIDRNLAYLNSRIGYFVGELGLPHAVRFLADLGVEISLQGRDYSFGQLSRGEQQRLILAMSFAFRDMWESQNRPVNLLFVDEVLDVGMDEAGSDVALALMTRMSRERGRNTFLISHKEHLMGRADTIMLVHKRDGFTSFEANADPG